LLSLLGPRGPREREALLLLFLQISWSGTSGKLVVDVTTGGQPYKPPIV